MSVQNASSQQAAFSHITEALQGHSHNMPHLQVHVEVGKKTILSYHAKSTKIWYGLEFPIHSMSNSKDLHAENTCVEIRGNAKFTPFKDLSDLKNETRMWHIAKRAKMERNKKKWYGQKFPILVLSNSRDFHPSKKRAEVQARDKFWKYKGSYNPKTENATVAHR